MSNKVQYSGGTIADQSSGLSNFWADCPIDEIQNGDRRGIHFFDDFLDLGLPGTQTSEINLGRYKVYNTGSGKVLISALPHSTSPVGAGGIISMLCDTAGDQSVIGTHQCPFALTSSSLKLWFEARIAVTSIATNTTHLFIGLGNNFDVQFGAAIPLADADATGTAVALLGFNRLEDGLGVLNSAYTDESAAYVNVQAGVGAIAAETWVKVGFTFDRSKGANCIEFYVNGVKGSGVLSASALAALTHLDASGLGPVFALFADSAGTDKYAYLDWWRCAQLLA